MITISIIIIIRYRKTVGNLVDIMSLYYCHINCIKML